MKKNHLKNNLYILLCITFAVLSFLTSCEDNIPTIDIGTQNDTIDINTEYLTGNTEESTDTSSSIEKDNWETIDYMIYSKSNKVVLYSSPDVNSIKLGEINIFEELLAKGKNDNWYSVNFNNGTAYIQCKYVTANMLEIKFNDILPSTKMCIKETCTEQIVLYNDILFSENSKALTITKTDTLNYTVYFLKENSEKTIYYIKYKEKFYYLKSEDIAYFDKTNWNSSNVVIYGMCNDIPIYEQASSNASKLGVINIGDSIIAIGNNGEWYKITYNNNIAYINDDYVTTSYNEATFKSCNPTELKIKNTIVNSSATNDIDKYIKVMLRTAPIIATDTATQQILIYSHTTNGELVKIAQNNANTWYRVTYQGETYYVESKFFNGWTANY